MARLENRMSWTLEAMERFFAAFYPRKEDAMIMANAAKEAFPEGAGVEEFASWLSHNML